MNNYKKLFSYEFIKSSMPSANTRIDELFCVDFLKTCSDNMCISDMFMYQNFSINYCGELSGISYEDKNNMVKRFTCFSSWDEFLVYALMFFILHNNAALTCAEKN